MANINLHLAIFSTNLLLHETCLLIMAIKYIGRVYRCKQSRVHSAEVAISASIA